MSPSCCAALLHSLASSETCLFRNLLVQGLACSETCLFRDLLVQRLACSETCLFRDLNSLHRTWRPKTLSVYDLILTVIQFQWPMLAILKSLSEGHEILVLSLIEWVLAVVQPYCTALLVQKLACSETCLFRDLLVQKLACSETCLFRNLLVQLLIFSQLWYSIVTIWIFTVNRVTTFTLVFLLISPFSSLFNFWAIAAACLAFR